MKPVFVEAIGLAAPGLDNWQSSKNVLVGAVEWSSAPETVYQPQSLPANERRRATPAVRMAFRVAEDARSQSELDFSTLPSVFASADADMGVINRMCQALSGAEQLVSPTDFHNSVHNAPSGYWSIATGSRGATTSIAGYDGSFASGLLETATWIATGEPAALLVACDLPPPPPLHAKRPIQTSGGVALVLSAQPLAGTIAALDLSLDGGNESQLPAAALETLRIGNPALRALPLLRLLATGKAGEVHLPYTDDRRLRVRVR
jgi:hypothetical protein